jgi:hypothetical protein
MLAGEITMFHGYFDEFSIPHPLITAHSFCSEETPMPGHGEELIRKNAG